MNKTSIIVIICLIISLFSLFFTISLYNRGMLKNVKPERTQLLGFVDRINKSREIHAGYGVYPPYTIEDPKTGKVNGFCIDIIETIGKELNCKVVWHRINWDTMSADLKRNEFDIIADPIFQTIPRAPEFAFSKPYAYFADCIVVVPKNVNYNSFYDIDKKGVRIAVGQNQASEALVRYRLKNATIVPIQAGTDNMLIFNGILNGRVDMAVADLVNAKQFANEHSKEVKLLFTDNPPAYVPAGFALRPGDREGAEFMNVCITYLEMTGVLDYLARKYNITTIKK